MVSFGFPSAAKVFADASSSIKIGGCVSRRNRATRSLVGVVLVAVPLVSLRAQVNDTDRVTRAYDIEFLVAEVPQFPSFDIGYAGSFRLEERGAIHLDEEVVGVPISFDEEEEAVGVEIDAESLVDLIRRNVAEDSWANRRNSIVARGSDLVVVNGASVHAEIEALLDRFRARRARMVSVDVALVPTAAVAGVGPIDASFDALVGNAGLDAHRVSLTAYNEQTVSGFTGRRRRYIDDNELNSTGVLPVVNPVVETVPLGFGVEVTPRVIPQTGGGVQLQLRAARVREAEPATKTETFFSEIEDVVLEERSLRSTLFVPPDRTVVAGILRAVHGDTTRDFSVVVRVRIVDLRKPTDASRARAPEEFYRAMYDVGLLVEAVEATDFGGRVPPRFTPKLLEALIRHSVDTDAWRDDRTEISWEDSLLSVTATSSTHAAVAEWLRARVEAAFRATQITVRVLTGAKSAVDALLASVEDEVYVTSEAIEAAIARDGDASLDELFYGALHGALGSPLRARGGVSRGAVLDLALASGGTGFRLASVPDPRIGSAGDGFEWRATVRPTLGDRLEVELDWELVTTRFERSADVRVSAEIVDDSKAVTPPAAPPPPEGDDKDASTSAFTSPGGGYVTLPFTLQQPSQSWVACRARLALRPNRYAIVKIQTGDTSGSAERSSVVLARVTAETAVTAEGGER